MSIDNFWEDSGSKYKLRTDALTMRDVLRVYQLDPAPSKMENINDYIVLAIQKHDNRYFSYFLHYHEKRLNSRVSRFLIREGLDRYDPLRFLDYKQGCVLAMLECLPSYDPDKGADFLTYAHHFIGNALLTCRMQEESGSFSSLDEYKAARGIAWLYNNSEKPAKEIIEEYARTNGCTEKTAEEYLTLARTIRNRVPFYATMQDEDSEETGEDVTRDDSWNYADMLWNGIRAEAVQKAFWSLGYRDRTLLEKRNAICMTCGRVSSTKTRLSFEELATMFEGSSAGGAEKAYRRAVEKLTRNLVDAGVLHAVELRKKKNAAAIYEYRVDYDGEWGEILFDFENGTAKIVRLADWDTVKTNQFAKAAIRYMLSMPTAALAKNTIFSFVI